MRFANNPIIARELVDQLRKPRSFWTLLSLLAVAALVFCWNYSSIVMGSVTGAEVSGRPLFFLIMYVGLLLGFPLAVGASASIVREREAETFDMLLSTPIAPGNILRGKFYASLLYFMLLGLSLLPFFSICFLLGGLSFHDVAQSVVLMVAWYFMATMLGLMISLLSSNAQAAGRFTSMALILFLGLPWVILVLVSFFIASSPDQRDVFSALILFNPIWALTEIYQPNPLSGNGGSIGQAIGANQYPGYVSSALLLVLCTLLFVACSFAFTRLTNQLSNSFSWRNLFHEWTTQLRRLGRTRPAAAAKSPPGITPWFTHRWQAVYQREHMTLSRSWLTQDRTIAIGTGLVGFAVTYLIIYATHNSARAEFPDPFLYYLSALFTFIVVVLFTPQSASNLMEVEYRRNTWPLLRTTEFRTQDLVWGKVLSAWRQSMFPLLVILITFYLGFFCLIPLFDVEIDNYQLRYTLPMLFITLAGLFFYCAAGAFFSSHPRFARTHPSRFTFALISIHLFAPFVFYTLWLSVLYAYEELAGQETAGPLLIQETLENPWVETILALSPLYLLREPIWSLNNDLIILIHSVCLIAAGLLVIHITGKIIARTE